ncbi:MAG: hypothetical protein P1U85_17385 [Verrucomicrobiales bacterium]|jgi:hypothetical protein|nr:hypothetical protein [Verrucomicrobiales bacterium]
MGEVAGLVLDFLLPEDFALPVEFVEDFEEGSATAFASLVASVFASSFSLGDSTSTMMMWGNYLNSIRTVFTRPVKK